MTPDSVRVKTKLAKPSRLDSGVPGQFGLTLMVQGLAVGEYASLSRAQSRGLP